MQILFLISLMIYCATAIINYTTTNGNTIVGDCHKLSMFFGKPEFLCSYKKTGNYAHHLSLPVTTDVVMSETLDYDSAITFMEYNNMLTLNCNAHLKHQLLEDFTFPYFTKLAIVSSVTIANCPIPRYNFTQVLKKVNVETSVLKVWGLALTPLRASYFAGLNLTSLQLEYDMKITARPRLPDDIVQYISSLTDLKITGAELPPLPKTTVLESMTLQSGTSRSSLGDCSHLRELTLINWYVESLDTEEGWLTTCYNLTYLELQTPSVDTLYRVLMQARSLRKLKINNLPERMFEIDIGITNASYIESVKIRRSKLFHFHIIDAIFIRLAELDLSYNDFDRRTLNYLHTALGRAPYVKNLTLADNPNLDLCEVNPTRSKQWSLWLPNLQRLVASRAATTGLCLQDLRAQSLELLDLTSCNITKLEFSGLPKLNNSQLELRLDDNAIEKVSFEDRDYDRFLESDNAVKPRELSIRELYLQRNRIQNFNANSLPETLKFLDLSNNAISYINEVTTTALFSTPDRRVKLADNAIVCDCQNQAFLTALNEHKEQVEDYEMLTCATDGQLISNVTVSTLCPKREPSKTIFLRVLLPILLIFTALIALIVAIYYKYGQAIKIFLYARGLCLCCLKEEKLDEDRPFDVFISFSHDDEEYVMNVLLPLLEKEHYKTCIHMRDWIIGEWIPKQISVSINISRRTLIVLSRSFVKSAWGMLEFRMAHASMLSEGRARLIIVMLDDIVKAEDLDCELKGYLRNNTYLETSDPWFWDKLRFALPRRGRAPSERHHECEVSADIARDFGPYGPVLSLVQMNGDRNINEIP